MSACESKIQTIYVKQKINKELLECENIEFKEIKTNLDFADFVARLYDTYTECKTKLFLIKKHYGE